MVQALTKHWLNKPHRSRRLCFSIYAQHCPSFAMPTYKENIFAYNEIYTLAALTDIATIVHNNGMRRIAYSLNIGIIWLCRTVLRILFSKLGERINIHYAVIRWAVRTDCLHGAYPVSYTHLIVPNSKLNTIFWNMKISRQFLLLRIFLAVSEFMLQCPIGSVIFSYNACLLYTSLR